MNARRLPEPWGSRLRRDRPLAFRFEGRSYEGCEGDTLASALLANGVTCCRARSSTTGRAAR